MPTGISSLQDLGLASMLACTALRLQSLVRLHGVKHHLLVLTEGVQNGADLSVPLREVHVAHAEVGALHKHRKVHLNTAWHLGADDDWTQQAQPSLVMQPLPKARPIMSPEHSLGCGTSK